MAGPHSHLPSLGDTENAGLRNVFKLYPDVYRPLLSFHEHLLRGPSALSVAERELVAAFVSGLNSCSYCAGIHDLTSQEFGIKPGLLAALVGSSSAVFSGVDTVDLAAYGVREEMRPVLLLARQLTVEPSGVTPAHTDPVLAVLPEEALHTTVLVSGLFNMMNRVVDGLGFKSNSRYAGIAAASLAGSGYDALKQFTEGKEVHHDVIPTADTPAATTSPADESSSPPPCS